MDPTHLFELVIAMFLAIIALHYVAQRLGLPPSVGLIVGGALLAFVPGLRAITVDPGLVLVIFLPRNVCTAPARSTTRPCTNWSATSTSRN
jgi:Kef-type K+ transport system membrane component KefB